MNARLARSRFDDVNLQDSTVTNANLAGIVCVDVNLTNASISNANVTGMRVNGVLVDDMVAAYRRQERDRATARDHGGDVLPREREWDFDGHRVCDGSDPEGNIFQLRE